MSEETSIVQWAVRYKDGALSTPSSTFAEADRVKKASEVAYAGYVKQGKHGIAATFEGAEIVTRVVTTIRGDWEPYVRPDDRPKQRGGRKKKSV